MLYDTHLWVFLIISHFLNIISHVKLSLVRINVPMLQKELQPKRTNRFLLPKRQEQMTLRSQELI